MNDQHQIPRRGDVDMLDEFAMHALSGIIASERDPNATDWYPQHWAELAYRTAEAMLAERTKRKAGA